MIQASTTTQPGEARGPASPAAPVRRVTYAYLGPAGTFSETALHSLPCAAEVESWPREDVSAALEAVRTDEADGAVVPLENSVEGVVTATLDELARNPPLMISGEVLLPVNFSLLARPGTRLGDVERVVTHPHAHGQCRSWLAGRFPEARVRAASSTAAAAASVAEGAADGVYEAAVAAPVAADHYRLETLATDIADRQGAVTRFVVVTPPGAPPQPTGADRTSLVAFLVEDHPGALLEMLSQFSTRGVNLTMIQSRPTGDGFGRYCFSIDCAGHVTDASVGEALMGLRRICAQVRFLGSYPRAHGVETPAEPGTSNGDFARAADWLARVRSG